MSNNTFMARGKRGFAWTWLAYTGFLFIQPILEPRAHLWARTLLVFATFVGIFWVYVRSSDRQETLRFWMIGATFALGMGTFPWNNGGSTFFVYAAAFLPFSIASVPRVLLLFLAEIAAIAADGYFFHVGLPNTVIAMFLPLVIGGGNIFFAQQKRADCQLRAAQEENVALAAVAERERIARDLHDVLGHTLSVIVLKAELAGRLLERGGENGSERARAEIGDVERTARTALAEVREAIGGYRARGLLAEVDAARRTLDSAGVEMQAEVTAAELVGVSAAEETVLALALREAVTNIVRHARASKCTLRLQAEGARRRLVIEDNGQHASGREGNGLRGMRERVEALGGSLQMERERGTRLLIDLPVATGSAAS